jgi:anti-sigma regulatory factor (Ser/Thr protein kinase)
VPGAIRSLTMAANTASLDAAMKFVRSGALEADLPEARVVELDLLIKEIFMNVCWHAYLDGKAGVVILSYSIPAPGELNVEVADRGSEFNPLTAVPPDVTLNLESRPIWRVRHPSGQGAGTVHGRSPGSRLEPSELRHIGGVVMATECG